MINEPGAGELDPEALAALGGLGGDTDMEEGIGRECFAHFTQAGFHSKRFQAWMDSSLLSVQ